MSLSGAESVEAGGAVQKQEVLKAVCRAEECGKAHTLWAAMRLVCSELSTVSSAPKRVFLAFRLLHFLNCLFT